MHKLIAPIHSGIRAGRNSKTGVDDFDRMLLLLLLESPQAPEDYSQQRNRCAWEAHELIKGPPRPMR